MRTTTAAAAALLTVAAAVEAGEQSTDDRFQLFNGCNQMHIRTFVVNNFASDENYGVTQSRVENLVESRLRAARLYAASDEPPDDLNNPTRLTIGVWFVGTGYFVDALFSKWVLDRTGLWGMTSTWSIRQRGTHGRRGESVMQSVSETVDRFILAFLRVNDDACR